ncbi:polysaccharide pyruvyl transferase family protein [Faecalicatena contorta]|uniref:Polysaccharide pyruvyl transferase n=1 Tax=Faecalicatena contorta TaxID=39482 RepID=A0A316A2S9_9FIRM|nr:polysaccharide pyruvyl transferase family protein [Faecalicatena contorta]PWJ51558.1 polysaccharide pyruvyl transferase [Faecalicatena contorta]SUQ13114.1 Polysaccharide pyruvyl transferase [Faecalicatena contorta]
MKIAGLTWWRNNYGSILQAYALQEYLGTIEGVDYKILCQYGKKIASVDNVIDKFKNIGIIPSLKRAYWKFGLKGLRERNKSIQEFVDNHLIISKNQYNEETIQYANDEFDCFICGSDQIWNPALTSVKSMYWLQFVNDNKKRIAYAPSVGVEKFSDDDMEVVKDNLRKFESISCREDSGTVVLNKLLEDNKCITVLDPTLLVERRLWDSVCSKRKTSEPYIFVYLLRGTKKQRKFIEEYAKRNKMKIMTMPFLDTEHIEIYDYKFGDEKIWEASPADFISMIRYSECVFTDSFHCMVFSCLYHRNFYSFPKIGVAQSNRIIDLQKSLCISNRIISDDMDFDDIDSLSKIDWNNVDSIIINKRTESANYLRKAILG